MIRYALMLLMLASAPANASGLTVKMGETWIFALAKGQPAKARKTAATAEPRRGEIKVTVKPMLGTTMTITSNNPGAFTYKATLVGADGKSLPSRSCALPPNKQLSFESWPQAAKEVRLSDFKPAPKGGNCP